VVFDAPRDDNVGDLPLRVDELIPKLTKRPEETQGRPTFSKLGFT
jgi:hypothetical protein